MLHLFRDGSYQNRWWCMPTCERYHRTGQLNAAGASLAIAARVPPSAAAEGRARDLCDVPTASNAGVWSSATDDAGRGVQRRVSKAALLQP
jgi:hypothetical protein